MDDELERCLHALGSIDVPAAPAVDALPRRHRSRWPLVAAAAAVVALLAASVAIIPNDDEESQLQTGDGSQTQGDTWRTIAPSPLSPRHGSAAVWTGEEMLVFGGTEQQPCPKGSTCDMEIPVGKRDGSAYRPSTDTWRRIADAPVELVGADAVWMGDHAIVRQRLRTSQMLSYDPAIDSWEALTPPPDALERGVPVDDHRIVYASNYRDDSSQADWIYDVDSDVWEPLPEDSLGPATDRSYVFTGGKLVLFGLKPVSTEDERERFDAAILDLESMIWRDIPHSNVGAGTNVWFGADGYAFTPGDSTTGAHGGILDLGAEQWGSLPSIEMESGGGSLPRVVNADPWIVSGGNYIFQPSTLAWHQVPSGPGPRDPNVGVWTGTEILVVGDSYELTSEGAAYTPPTRVGPDPNEPASSTRADLPECPDPTVGARSLGSAWTYDYQPSASPSELATAAGTAAVGVVNDAGIDDDRTWIKMLVDDAVMGGPLAEEIEITLESDLSGEAEGPDRDAVLGLRVFAFLAEGNVVGGGYVASLEGLWFSCSDDDDAIPAKLEPVMDGWPSEPTIELLVDLVLDPPVLIDGPVIHRSGLRPEEGGEGALQEGTLELVDNCLVVASDAERSLLIWPAGTQWDSEAATVVLADRSRFAVGDQVSLGGGEAVGEVRYQFGEAVGDAIDACAELVGTPGTPVFLINSP